MPQSTPQRSALATAPMRATRNGRSGYRRVAGMVATGLCALAIGAASLVVPVAHAEAERWTLDPEHLSIGFLVDHAGFAKTLGMFREAEGEFVFDQGAQRIESGEIRVRTESVFTNHDARDDHLRNADFLNVSRHPEMTFRARRWEPTGNATGRLHGELELLGQRRPLVLDTTINKVDRYPFPLGSVFNRPMVLGASMHGSFDRSDFGMTYGLRPREIVGDEVELIIEFEARRD